MRIEETKFFQEYIDMAMHGDEMGWHERNGGNFTYWLKEEEVDAVRDQLHPGNWLPIGTEVPKLQNEYFLISGTGQFFHNMRRDPMHTCGIIQVDPTGTQYRICWGLLDGGRPTSELPTHLMNMAVRAVHTNDRNRVIYHCHCPNVIAMTFLLEPDADLFSKELWESMTECPIIFPEGVGVLRWMVPGGREIAEATAACMERYNAVIWCHHGIFCSGPDFDTTFGLMHTIEKSAEIWIKIHSCADHKRQTITRQDFIRLADAFHVTLNPDVLKRCV
jgi:rhamnulose-1-phosphate aldolase